MNHPCRRSIGKPWSKSHSRPVTEEQQSKLRDATTSAPSAKAFIGTSKFRVKFNLPLIPPCTGSLCRSRRSRSGQARKFVTRSTSQLTAPSKMMRPFSPMPCGSRHDVSVFVPTSPEIVEADGIVARCCRSDVFAHPVVPLDAKIHPQRAREQDADTVEVSNSRRAPSLGLRSFSKASTEMMRYPNRQNRGFRLPYVFQSNQIDERRIGAMPVTIRIFWKPVVRDAW